MLENLYAIYKEKEVNPIGIWIRVFFPDERLLDQLGSLLPPKCHLFSDKTNWWTIHNLMFLGRASKASYVQKQISLFG